MHTALRPTDHKHLDLRRIELLGSFPAAEVIMPEARNKSDPEFSNVPFALAGGLRRVRGPTPSQFTPQVACFESIMHNGTILH